MSVIDIRPVPGANGDIRKAIEIIKNSVPRTPWSCAPTSGTYFRVQASSEKL